MRLLIRLVTVLGKRTFLTFGIVTFLVGALLAATELTSRYALKLFVEDQLARIPWDVAVYQRGGVTLEDEVPRQMRAVPNVKQVESMAFLRASFPPEGQVVSEVDGQPLATPWICMISASDQSLLPPKFRTALNEAAQNRAGPADAAAGDAAAPGVMALVGPERAISKAFLGLQGAQEFTINVDVGADRRSLFALPINGVVRQERDELNRWFMDEIGSIAFVPYISTILLTPFNSASLLKFDSVATGVVPMDLIGPEEQQYGHVQPAEYEAEVIYVSKIDRTKLISGWDIGGSLERMTATRDKMQQAVDALGTTQLNVDSTTLVLLERMNNIARLIGIVSILIALPLLWMAWVLAANLSALLMLNERRKLGLMRLRGVPAEKMGRAVMLSVVGGGLLGGILGLAFGSLAPLAIYEGGSLPLGVLTDSQHLLLLGAFLVITVVLALEVSRRFIVYVTTISPLEASTRVASSEAGTTGVRFGIFQCVALLLGLYKVTLWITGLSPFSSEPGSVWAGANRALDFLGLPLLLYGLTTLIVSHKSWIMALVSPLVRVFGGRLAMFSMRQMAVKPHRAAAFLFIVALMTSISVYPIVTSASFQDKAQRGARVNLGADWQLIFNSPDLASVEALSGTLSEQITAIMPGVEKLTAGLRGVNGVKSTTVLVEAILPNFYLPDYGLRGVPLYLIVNPAEYKGNMYSEPELGIGEQFSGVLDRVIAQSVAVSPPVAEFWRTGVGTPLILGRDDSQRSIQAPVAGVLAFLPGMPPKSVQDRQGYVQERLDYLNAIFQNNAYLAGDAASKEWSGMRVLIPRVIVLAGLDSVAGAGPSEDQLRGALPFAPIEVHSLADELRKTGSDMFIFLVLENMRIYLFGGLLLALIGIVAIAMANYMEDRHTLGLLRVRGTPPRLLWRYLLSIIICPAVLGMALGGLAALVAGYGLASYLWELREIQSVVGYLPTRMVVSALSVEVVLLILVMLVGVTLGFNAWVFRKSARENMRAS